MATVALRGTLIRDGGGEGGDAGNGKNGSSGNNHNISAAVANSSTSSRSISWQWKGMWAFGGSLATAAAQMQQPFLYSFQQPTHPSEVAVPGMNNQAENNNSSQENNTNDETGCASAASSSATATATHTPSLTASDESAIAMETNMTKTTTTTTTRIQASEDKQKDEIKEPGGDNSNKASAASSDDTEVTSNHTNADNTQQQPASASLAKPEFISFDTVPEGHPAFTDACVHYPNTPPSCPPSGQWKGYFQNGPGTRPRDKMQKIQETFYLFFNATPGPDVRYVFDDTPLPPTVHLESLVLVRGE